MAVGVLSGNAPVNARRRAAIRGSWLRFPSVSVGSTVVRFVVRCGRDTSFSAALRAEASRHPSDMLCTPLDEQCSSVGCRTRGTVQALVYWIRHALLSFATVQFVAKADVRR